MSKYTNPDNVDEIMNELKNAKVHGEVVKIMNKTFPGWIIGWPKKFSDDYPIFSEHWNKICSDLKVQPLCILIVDHIAFADNDYTLLSSFCELLTLFGHCVRRKEEFFECKLCGSVLPNQSVYEKLKKDGVKVPEVWMMRCSTC